MYSWLESIGVFQAMLERVSPEYHADCFKGFDFCLALTRLLDDSQGPAGNRVGPS